jgi:hypothetical protein
MPTTALDIATVLEALRALEDDVFQGASTLWTPKSANADLQVRLLKLREQLRQEIKAVPGMASKVSTDHNELNRFLEQRGSDLRLDPFDGYGVASLIKLAGKWSRASAAKLTGQDDKRYPAVHIKQDVTVYEHPYVEALVRVSTESGFTMWACPVEPLGPLSDDLALFEAGLALLDRSIRPTVTRYECVILPMLDIDLKPSLDWCLGMATNGYFISQALQALRVQLNEFGFSAKADTALAMERVIIGFGGSQSYILNQPFLGFWTYGDSRLPLCPFRANTDTWRNPGRIEAIGA